MLRLLILVIAAGTLGLSLLAHGAPRVVAAINTKVATPYLDKLEQDGALPTPAQFDLIFHAHDVSLKWHENPLVRRDLAAVQSIYALTLLGASQDASAAINAARHNLERALAANPASHVAWSMLAELDLIDNRPRQAAGMLARSYRVVPLDFDNSLGRLSLSLQLLPLLDLATIELVAAETSAMARARLRELAAVATEVDRADAVRILLERSAVEEEIIDRYVEEARRLIGIDPT
jgi:hypothetical protein